MPLFMRLWELCSKSDLHYFFLFFNIFSLFFIEKSSILDLKVRIARLSRTLHGQLPYPSWTTAVPFMDKCRTLRGQLPYPSWTTTVPFVDNYRTQNRANPLIMPVRISSNQVSNQVYNQVYNQECNQVYQSSLNWFWIDWFSPKNSFFTDKKSKGASFMYFTLLNSCILDITHNPALVLFDEAHQAYEA